MTTADSKQPTTSALVNVCRQMVDSVRFDLAMLSVILLNAIVLGVETYDGISDNTRNKLATLNDIFLMVFIWELSVRLIARWPRPDRALKDRWNVFDALVILANFTPGLRENVTMLRLVRILRVVRVIRFLPDLRIVLMAISRSIPGVATLAVATALLIYVYGMAGWMLFGAEDTKDFGDIGAATLTMFMMLTLENLPDFMSRGQAITGLAVPFYVSYVLIASFLVFNLFIGIVINSMEDARQEELALKNRAAGRDDLALRLERLQQDLSQITHELQMERRGQAEAGQYENAT